MAAKSPKPIVIFNATDYDTWQRELKALDAIEPTCDLADQCGHDTAQHRQMAQDARSALQQLISVWFPNGRPKT